MAALEGRGMTLKQTVYFMALVGAIAGLACWTIQPWMADVLTVGPELTWILSCLGGALMGAFIGGMTVGFADHWTSDRVVPSWVAIGVGSGTIAGFLSGVIALALRSRLPLADGSTFGGVISGSLTWLIAGGLIGTVIGLRWVAVNPLRAVHALTGGLFGGAFGGFILTLVGNNLFIAPLAYMLIGTGITLGVTLAPMLLSDGVLRFISSADARAQNKYGSPRQEWIIQDGDRMVIGSQSADMSATMWSQDVQVYIPDAMVSRRHAVLFSKKKRFFVQLHPDNAGTHGQPVSPLQVGDENVTGTRELRNNDELVVGQTLLRFLTKRRPSAGKDSQGESRAR
jgi:hypothetical protein